MNRNEKRGRLPGAAPPQPSNLEKYALAVEGLDAGAIERACAQDGAAPGGAPPAWDKRDPHDWLAKRREAERRVASTPPALDAPRRVPPEWETAAGAPGRVVALGHAMDDAGIHDRGVYELDRDAMPCDGDIVAVDILGVGQVLRRLQVIGGARLLIADDPEVPAIPIEADGSFRCYGVVRRPRSGLG